jgi:hypothetical protein
MFDGSRITDPYRPDDGLLELLNDTAHESEFETVRTVESSSCDQESAQHFYYTIELRDHTITGCTTVLSYSLVISLQGSQEMTSALILALSLQHGEPTLIYEDRVKSPRGGSDYEGITTEWYSQSAIELGIPERRREDRKGFHDTKEVPVELLEQRAQDASSD